MNEDPDFMPGSHWVGIYIDKYGYSYFFDSFGRNPKGTILNFILRNSLMYTYNTKQIQHLMSDVCGKYCILFLLNYALGNNVDQFINMFSSSYKKNDVICAKLFKQYFK